MKIETIEACPTCYGLGYKRIGSDSYGIEDEQGYIVVHESSVVCPTCKGYGVVLVITEIPDDMGIIETRINKNDQTKM